MTLSIAEIERRPSPGGLFMYYDKHQVGVELMCSDVRQEDTHHCCYRQNVKRTTSYYKGPLVSRP
jgi:hypothetical protein